MTSENFDLYQISAMRYFDAFSIILCGARVSLTFLRADAEYLCSFDKCCVAEDKQLLNGLFRFEFTEFTGKVSDSIFSNKRAK